MRPIEIEAWALRIVEQVKRAQPDEDTLVELKAEWLSDTYKAARQIAGHANAASGESVLWLIGIDQKKGIVVGAEQKELANWYKQVESHFDGLAPSVTDINVPIDDKIIVALLFNTDRAPFVVKAQPSSGSLTHEVPWRGNTSIRSAKREELVRLLAPLQRLPKWDILFGTLHCNPPSRSTAIASSPTSKIHWRLRLKLYVIPVGDSRICIPHHRCSGVLSFPDFGIEAAVKLIAMTPAGSYTVNVQTTLFDLMINGPGMIILTAEGSSIYQGTVPRADCCLSLDLRTADSVHPVTVRASFIFDHAHGNRWICGDANHEKNSF
jgi:hypothetical protein